MRGHTSFRSGNPSLNKNTFQSFSVTSENKMTLDGTVNKTGISSKLVFLNNRPKFVILLTSSSALYDGPTSIDLNFIILNGFPLSPSLL